MYTRTFFSFISTLLLFTFSAKADVILHDLQGQKIPFSSLKGKWVLINYWASWCQPCLDEIPELNRFYKQYQHKQLALFGVNYDVLPVAEQQVLLQRYRIVYPNLRQDPAPQLNLGDIHGVPVTFVFNPQGKWTQTLYGSQTAKSLLKAIS